MKKTLFILLAAIYSFAAFAQTQGTRKFRAWYDDVIIWQCDAALIDSLNFFIDTQSGTEGDNNTGSGSAEEKAQIYVGVVAFNKSVSQMPITKEVEKAKTFIRERTNDQDFTAFAYSVSQGNKLFDAEGLPEFDKIFMLNFSDGTDNYSNMLWGMEGRMVGLANVYDTARYDLLQRAELNSYAMTFGNDEGFSTKMRQVVKGSGKYHNAETSADLQTTFTEIAQSIIASAKNVVLTTNPGFYSEEMGYKYFRFNITADNGVQDTIYAKLEGTPFMGFTLNITQAGKYTSFDAPVQGVYDQENTGKVLLPLNNLKFVYNGEELHYTFEPYYSPDNNLFYTDVEEASTEDNISKRIAVVLVLDCSKSMADAFEPMKEAAINFIETLETIAPIITVTPNDTAMGTITGGGAYENGEVVTLTAVPNKGYRFVRWSDYDTNNPRTLTVTASIQLTAIFEAMSHTISVSTSSSKMGTVSGGGTFTTAEIATLTATPKNGYAFVQWSDGNTENPRTIKVDESLNLTAEFEALSHAIIVSVNDETMGSVTGAGTYKTAEVATLTATPAEGHRFVRWSNGTNTNPYEFTVTENINLTATFAKDEYVDLGLPSGTLWATYNIGATSPEGYGNYFAWAEISTKETYSWSTYKWSYNNSTNYLIKYCPNSYYSSSYRDNLQTIELTDDVAHIIWGGDWRIPTKAQWDELISNCTWTWTDNYNETGRKGYIVTSTAVNNTNSIFLPTAGYRYDASFNTSDTGRYWSSSLYYDDADQAYYLSFGSSSKNVSYNYRYYGYPIRPVCPAK